MTAPPLNDTKRLCVHTITTKPWSLRDCCEHYPRAGVAGITVWRDVLQKEGVAEGGRLLRDSGLKVVSLCRGGFFPGKTQGERQSAIDDNKRAIDEAAAIGAPLIVMVCGAVPGQPLEQSRAQIRAGIEAILPYAQQHGVKLAIEPLHPMYADSRSAINTIGQANDLVEAIGSPWLGVTIDVYHLWWDPHLEREINRAAPWLFSYHVCDWRTPTRDLLTDRGLMGEGCIPLRDIRAWVERAGFGGMIEVEIFSTDLWATDQHEFLERIRLAYLDYV